MQSRDFLDVLFNDNNLLHVALCFTSLKKKKKIKLFSDVGMKTEAHTNNVTFG